MRRNKFQPVLAALENRELLSAGGGKPPHSRPPHLHASAHVRPHVVKAPHTVLHHSWTGTRISGQVALDTAAPATNAVAVSVSGAGELTIGSAKSTNKVCIDYNPDTQYGTLVITAANGSTINADVTMLPDGSAGNYEITSATGDYAGAHGTGVLYVRADVVAINPHTSL